MPDRVPFERVCAFLEAHGWRLMRVWRPWRVFTKPGRLPILVRLEDKAVDAGDFERIRAIIAKDAPAGDEE